MIPYFVLLTFNIYPGFRTRRNRAALFVWLSTFLLSMYLLKHA